ncbi:hypothetical protein ELY10_09980 [Legionella septentrionalis]|nr:hypothetical protein ELY10_09980 [Legionella septentrionalis]
MGYLKSAAYIIFLVFILLASLVLFLLTTTPGLYVALQLANLTLPGTLEIHHPQGRLIDELSFSELTYADDTLTVRLVHGRINWKLTSLLHRNFSISRLYAREVLIDIKDTPKAIEQTASQDFSFPTLPVDLTIHKLTIKKIEFRQLGITHQVQKFHAKAVLNNKIWDFPELSAAYGDYAFSLQATGGVQAPYVLTASLHVMPLDLQKEQLQAHFNLNGDLNLYHLQGQLSGPVQGNVAGLLKKGRDVHVKISWNHLKWPIHDKQNVETKKGNITVTGTLPNLNIQSEVDLLTPVAAQWTMQAWVKDKKVHARSVIRTAQGNITNTLAYDEKSQPKLQGQLTSKSFNLIPLGIPIDELQFTTKFSGDSVKTLSAYSNLSGRYLNTLLQANVSYAEEKVKGRIALGPNTITFKGQPPLQLEAAFTLPQPKLLTEALAGLETTLTGKLILRDEQHGKLNLAVGAGKYQSAQDPDLPPILFQGGNINFNLQPDKLKIAGMLIIDPNKKLNLNFNFPKFHLTQFNLARQSVDGKLNLRINSLQFLKGLSPLFEKPEGELTMNFLVKGKVQKPVVEGELLLNKGYVFIPKLNLTLNPIEIRLISQNQHWTAKGIAHAKGKNLTIDGNGQFTPGLSGMIKLTGEQFPLMDTAETTLNISPNLTLTFKNNAFALDGTVLVPSATLKPISFSSTVDLSEDAVFVQDEPAAAPLNLTTNVKIVMGDHVELDIKGLHGFLDGSLQIKQYPKQPPFAVGELTIRDGTYKAYGQDLTIQEGQLLFSGGMITNPGIRIRAIRTFKNASGNFSGSNQLFDFNPGNLQTLDLGNKTIVGIEVSGRISSTKVKLFSIPANLSQADILSMLILGKPANQASKSGGQLLLTAISAMDLDSGTKGVQLLDQLKQALGFDFNLESTSQYNQQTNQMTDGTAFVVGKSLTNRLYLSYNIGLFQEDSNVLTLKYLLNKFFSLQVTASDSGSGIDLLYTHSQD